MRHPIDLPALYASVLLSCTQCQIVKPLRAHNNNNKRPIKCPLNFRQVTCALEVTLLQNATPQVLGEFMHSFAAGLGNAKDPCQPCWNVQSSPPASCSSSAQAKLCRQQPGDCQSSSLPPSDKQHPSLEQAPTWHGGHHEQGEAQQDRHDLHQEGTGCSNRG